MHTTPSILSVLSWAIKNFEIVAISYTQTWVL